MANKDATTQILTKEELTLETGPHWKGLGLGLKLRNVSASAMEECRLCITDLSRWSERHGKFEEYSHKFEPLTLPGESVLEPDTSASFELIAVGLKQKIEISGIRNARQVREARDKAGVYRVELLLRAGRGPRSRSRTEEVFLLVQKGHDVQFTDDPRKPTSSSGPAATHGDDLTEKVAAELRVIRETKDRDAALDKKATILAELCFDAFVQKMTQLKQNGTLSDRSSVVKAARPGAVFALEAGSSYRGPQNGITAFQYCLSPRDGNAQAKGWIQVEVPEDSRGDPLLVVRWNPTNPRERAERVLQQLASGLSRGGVALVKERAEGQMKGVFGQAMNQLLRLLDAKR